jgi:uncharacterized tannase-like protein DUF6351
MTTRFFSIAVAAASIAALTTMPYAASPGRLEITTLSTDAQRVTGGDVLVQIALPPAADVRALKIAANGKDVTPAFRAAAPHTAVGLVTGLSTGRNTLTADVRGSARATLEITNYPITGPVISGPWQQPFICQTDAFKLPDGSTLGPPLDANCSAKTVVQYVYWNPRANDGKGAFESLADPTKLPPAVVKTTTMTGETVNFVVRVETGTMNRGIYQNAILHDPTVDPPPTPFAPPKGWNKRLVGVHGTGCPSGWYIQGAALGVPVLDRARLAQGYALFNNTLNHPTNSCNAFLAGETAMMGKEHFIETFGVPFYTISTGNSGGAYTSLQIADAFPGLFDGVTIGATFPDALSIALSGLDAHLLMHYFATDAATFSDAQKVAVSGYHGMEAFLDAANQSQRTDPVPGRVDGEGYRSARWNNAVPAALRYDPAKNPKGARPTVFDAAKNIYGVDTATGAALRPFDNVGVQYGLTALKAGIITPTQFLDLNQSIGGVDRDSNYTASRAVGDAPAIRRAYQAGLTLGANGGLKSIPIFDNAQTNETGGYHYAWFHFALRDRIREANNGSSDNLVMWRSINAVAAQDYFDRWMAAYKSDASSDTQRAKVLRAKPAEFVEGCYDTSTPPKFIAEPLDFTSKPVSTCSALYPVYSNPRREAGGPLSANTIKCQLKPIDAKDYKVSFTPDELARLKNIFAAGVCDWSKPGVNQTPVVTWASFGPSPVNAIADSKETSHGSTDPVRARAGRRPGGR